MYAHMRYISDNPTGILMPQYVGEIVKANSGQMWIACPQPGQPLSANDWAQYFEISVV